MSVSRNAPCPCGSGKKYKQCCGKQAETGINLDALLNQAFGLHQAGHLPQAAALYQQILAQRPNHPDALHLLGLAFQQAGRLDEAKRMIEQAVRIKPDAPMYRHNLVNVLFAMNHLDEARRHAEVVLRFHPEMTETLHALGTILQRQGRMEDSIDLFRQVLARQPAHLHGLFNLGKSLYESSQPEAALPHFLKLLQIAPEMLEGRFAYGAALKMAGRFSEAESCFREVLETQPDHEGALQNLADLLQTTNRLPESRLVYEKLLQHQPDNALAHLGLATCLLAQGLFEQGWTEYAWRMRRVFAGGHTKKRPFPHPWWQGESLAGKRLLVWGEQGIGDEILFASMFNDVLQSGAIVTLECEARLLDLFSRSFPQAAVFPREGEIFEAPVKALGDQTFDWQIPAGALAQWYRRSLQEFPGTVAYLKPASPVVEHHCTWLDSLGDEPKVGIAWRSMLRDGVRNTFYTELKQWGEVLKVKGVTLVNLQYGDCEDELREAESLFGVTIHRAPGLDLKDDLDGAAALTRALDLVIAPNTSVFAMAGAVGTPTWLLNLDSDWTMLGTNRMPWFPSVEVFAKSWEEPWENVLSKVAARLSEIMDDVA